MAYKKYTVQGPTVTYVQKEITLLFPQKTCKKAKILHQLGRFRSRSRLEEPNLSMVIKSCQKIYVEKCRKKISVDAVLNDRNRINVFTLFLRRYCRPSGMTRPIASVVRAPLLRHRNRPSHPRDDLRRLFNRLLGENFNRQYRQKRKSRIYASFWYIYRTGKVALFISYQRFYPTNSQLA